jgi:hypothetical protein
MKPTPQASFSREGSQRPCGTGQPSGEADFLDMELDETWEIQILESHEWFMQFPNDDYCVIEVCSITIKRK